MFEMTRRQFLRKSAEAIAALSLTACVKGIPGGEQLLKKLEEESFPRPQDKTESYDAIAGYTEKGPKKYTGTWISNAGQGDYFLPPKNAFLGAVTEHTSEEETTTKDLLYNLGFYLDTEKTVDEENEDLIKNNIKIVFGEKEAEFRKKAEKLIIELAREPSFKKIIINHINNGGIFFFYEGKGGHYDPARIEIGIRPDTEKTKGVLIHELLHGITEKQNIPPTDRSDTGGRDHLVINALEERIIFVEKLLAGKNPLQVKNLQPDPNETNDPRHKLHHLLDTNDLSEIIEYTKTSQFARQKTRSDMSRPVLNREFLKYVRQCTAQEGETEVRITEDKLPPQDCKFKRWEKYNLVTIELGDVFGENTEQDAFIADLAKKLTPTEQTLFTELKQKMQTDKNWGKSHIETDDELSEIAYLNAIQNAIYNEAIKLLALVAQKYNIDIKKATSTSEVQKNFKKFLAIYSKILSQTPGAPPIFLARKAMDFCLEQQAA